MTLTKTKVILFASVFVVAAMLLPYGMYLTEPRVSYPPSFYAEAAPNQNANERAQQNTPNENANQRAHQNMEEPPESGLVPFLKDYEFKTPSLINENALNGLKIAVTKNPQVKELLGDDFEYINYHQYGTDYGWQPVLNFRTDNGENTVTVTMDKGKVVDVLKRKTINLGGPILDDDQLLHFGQTRSHIIDEYDDDRYNARGMIMVVDVPDYTHNAGDFTALLLNAVKKGSNSANLCDKTKYLTDYWGQVGFLFNEDGATIVYTDTTLWCEAQTFPSIQYNAGDKIVFANYIDDANDKWYLYVDNLNDSSPPHAWVTILPGISFLDTNNKNTSVFFESANHWWFGDWASGFASDPVVDVAAWQYTNGGWYVWFGEDQFAGNCEEGTTASQLMSGTFVGSPYDVTFDVSEIQERCPAPDL